MRHVGSRGQALGEKTLEGGEVRRDAFQDEIDLAVEHVALAHQRPLGDAGLERPQIRLGLAVQPHHGEHGDVKAQILLGQLRVIAADQPRLFQGPHPAQAGRRGDADAF